ncbi:MAG: hypothetical protein CL916_14200, partial [Deltaproteobacteria bacterium]|nr:hypothetical protein [Deltaproteobacteria bacterium]
MQSKFIIFSSFGLLACLLPTTAFASDGDGDGIDDIDEDINGNGIVDEGETDPNNPDTDDDGIDDGVDVCPVIADPYQLDCNNDGLGDACNLGYTMNSSDSVYLNNGLNPTDNGYKGVKANSWFLSFFEITQQGILHEPTCWWSSYFTSDGVAYEQHLDSVEQTSCESVTYTGSYYTMTEPYAMTWTKTITMHDGFALFTTTLEPKSSFYEMGNHKIINRQSGGLGWVDQDIALIRGSSGHYSVLQTHESYYKDITINHFAEQHLAEGATYDGFQLVEPTGYPLGEGILGYDPDGVVSQFFNQTYHSSNYELGYGPAEFASKYSYSTVPTASSSSVTFGWGTGDLAMADSDGDTILDSTDNCILIVNAQQTDSNGDGIGDACSDTDSDGLFDWEEVIAGSDINLSDTDSDGLSDYDEVYTHLTDPSLADTDSDGLLDGDEIDTHLTDPLLADTDSDGLLDGEEIDTHLSDPSLADTDSDGLSDYDEVNTHLSDPSLADTDSDGLGDYDEVNTHNTDPLLADTDSDGLNDYDEVNTHNTDPSLADSDSDGLSDYDEVTTHSSDPLLADTDSDGLSDYDEVNIHSTDPSLTDTDSDGLSDYDEVNTTGS